MHKPQRPPRLILYSNLKSHFNPLILTACLSCIPTPSAPPLLVVALLADTNVLAIAIANMNITVSNDPNCNANGFGINFTIPLSYTTQTTNFGNASI